MKIWKISQTTVVTFLGKSFSEWNKVEKPTVDPMSYEGSHKGVKTDFGNNKKK